MFVCLSVLTPRQITQRFVAVLSQTSTSPTYASYAQTFVTNLESHNFSFQKLKGSNMLQHDNDPGHKGTWCAKVGVEKLTWPV